MTNHKNGTARVLQDFEHVQKMESAKVEQDRKDTASAFVAELASIKEDALKSYSSTTVIGSSIEKAQPSAKSAPRSYQNQDPTCTSKGLFSFASLDKPVPASSKWKIKMMPCLSGKELSTHMSTLKIEDDTIQCITMLHG